MERDSLLYKITEGLRDMCYICVKEMKTTVTDEGVLIFFILVPVLYPLLYSWIYIEQVVREVPVAVIDMSHSHASRDFISHYNASPDVKVTYYCNNIKEAQSLMGHQDVKGVLYFPYRFPKEN
jgi:ABC-2 type transport system permease protein